MTIEELVEEYRKALKALASAQTDEMRIKEDIKIYLAQGVNGLPDMPVTRAEVAMKAQTQYATMTRDLVTATEVLENAKADVEYYRVRWDTWRTKMATQREKMRNG